MYRCAMLHNAGAEKKLMASPSKAIQSLAFLRLQCKPQPFRLALPRLSFLIPLPLVVVAGAEMKLFGLFDYYYEADIAGNVQFPEGVQFILASFPTLFGTPDGIKVCHHGALAF